MQEPVCAQGHIKHYQGGEHCIFFHNPQLGIGEELFWDFHGWFDYGKLSFTKFCSQMTHHYQSTHPNSAAFMSNHTFIELFFSWIVRMGIDFRQEVDPWCGYDPKVLACDGTHVGVSLRMQNLKEPITQPELRDQKLKPKHKKNQRCFLPYPQKGKFSSVAQWNQVRVCTVTARNHLFTLCCRELKEIFFVIDAKDEKEREKHEREELLCMDALLQTLDRLKLETEGIARFVNLFIKKELHPSVMTPAAKLIKLLLKADAAVSVLLPFWSHTLLQECLEAVESNSSDLCLKLEKFKLYGLEVAELLDAGASENTAEVVGFLKELLQTVIDVHSTDREAAPPRQIPHTYNPPSGICYYFTEHGCKVREVPSYEINPPKKGKNHRVPPCTKVFPKVSTGGFGYLFLFFCPFHGHCYGFHLVDGGEGRKDPFSALYKYKPTPPTDLFYDFACQLDEYCLNREPAFFKWMRVWHDLFHGCNHFCVPCFKSTRVLGLTDANSEICEQFNSYLQSIKFTGSHLSQPHFMLFTQFMVFLWNKEKTKKFNEIKAVAFAGLQ